MEREQFKNLIGKTVAEAEELTGLRIRTTWKDGQPMIVTHDLRGDRLNVRVENGLITKVENIG